MLNMEVGLCMPKILEGIIAFTIFLLLFSSNIKGFFSV